MQEKWDVWHWIGAIYCGVIAYGVVGLFVAGVVLGFLRFCGLIR